jgi:hypothetical protein
MIPSWIMTKGEHRNTFDRMVCRILIFNFFKFSILLLEIMVVLESYK